MADGHPPSGWSGGNPEDFTALTLVRVATAMQGVFVAALEPYDLSPHEFSVLLHLVESPGCNQAHLAREVLATRQSVGELLRKMEDLGLIERTPPAGRGRPAAVYASPHGRALLDEVTPHVLAAFRPEALDLHTATLDRLNVDLHTILAALTP